VTGRIKKGWARDFFQVPNEIYDRRDISGYAKAVFVYLCRRADDDSQAFPTHARVAGDVGFSESTVRRAIDSLIEAGLLTRQPRYDGRGFQVSNIYTLIRPSTVPERGAAAPSPGKDEVEPPAGSPGPVMEQGVLQELPGSNAVAGCSVRPGGVLQENSQGALVEQAVCSGRTGRVFCENTKEYPDQKYPMEKDPGEKDQSVCPSVLSTGPPARDKRPADWRIDFSDPKQVIKYYSDRFGATERQVVMAMLSVQAQVDKRTVIMDYKAYFEKTLQQLLQDEDFRKHFV